MKKGRRPRRRPRLKLSDKAGPDQCPVPGENALFPAQIAGFLAVSRPVPVYPVFLNYVVPVHQRNIYHQLNQEAHTAIEACGGSAQGQSTMAKLNTKMGIGLKTLTDKSTRNLAEMLTQGSGMGVVDCVKSCKDYPNAAPGAKRLAQRLQDFEEDNRIQLERFL